MDYNVDELEWKCLDCGVTAPPTNADYMKILKHQKGHHIQPMNKVTGEVIANGLKGAQGKGIDIPGKPTETTCSKPVLELRLNYDKFTLKLEISFDGGSSFLLSTCQISVKLARAILPFSK